MRPRLTSLLWLLLVPGLAHAQEERVPVTVLVSGEPSAPVRAALEDPGDLPVETSFATLPQAPTPSQASVADIAAARGAYINAEFGACLRGLEDEARVHDALAAGQREVAARVLFWRVACHVGAADLEAARRAAARFATFGLSVPADAEAASPEVESVLAAALSAQEEARRHPLEVRANTAAAVSVDGGPPHCETPCAVDLVAGDHMLTLRAPGFAPTSHLVRVEDGAGETTLRLDEASPELAAAQWAERWLGHEGRDSPPSVRLLARAVRARRLVLVLVDPAAQGSYLRGVLAVDGRIAARAEHTGGALASGARDVLRELLVEGELVAAGEEFYESPWFWIGIGVAAAAAAAVTAVLLVVPETQTCVSFGPEGCR